MFDIGFLELFAVFVIGLLVIGPDRLPETIKTGAIWFSRLKRSISDARTEFEQQIGADEIRREIHNEKIMDSVRAIEEARSSVVQKIADVNKDLEDVARDAEAKLTSSDSNENPDGGQADEPHPPMLSDDLQDGESPAELPGRKPVESDTAENQKTK